MKCLNGSSLNPKSELTTKHVTKTNIEKVFGKFKTTNTHLHVDTKKKLSHLCSWFYGTSTITNNKFMSWLIKGYIVETKGRDVNWARATMSTTKEKVHRVQVEKMKNNNKS